MRLGRTVILLWIFLLSPLRVVGAIIESVKWAALTPLDVAKVEVTIVATSHVSIVLNVEGSVTGGILVFEVWDGWWRPYPGRRRLSLDTVTGRMDIAPVNQEWVGWVTLWNRFRVRLETMIQGRGRVHLVVIRN